MQKQNTKFIDVTKTFLPVDPNSFPESMQGTSGEDNPEQRIPSSAYEGFNFLPTSYGYKSYFGTTGKLNIDNLPSRADYIILFQTQTFENLLIALTEEGVFIKNGAATGAWTQLLSYLPPTDASMHFNWSFVVISNVFYAYQQNRPSYVKIASLAAAPYYTYSYATPNFLNMSGQIGIFRAGGRLGFWDSADSVGWSNQDDFTDFTPSIETLAGNSVFSDVNGRIVTIKPHGPGFMIYASKSIVYIQENAESTYQWTPQVVLSNSGVSYPTDIAIAVPDTRHFAYTSTGLYEIEKAIGKIIVPEVTDFLKEANGPIYPRILEGRYLFLQTIDQNYINGQAVFTDEIVQGPSYYFPGSSTLVDATTDYTLRGTDICGIFNGMDQAGFKDQQGPGVAGGINLPGQKAGTKATPIWTCYISNNASSPGNVTWSAVPCGPSNLDGIPQLMSPNGDGHRLDKTTTTSVGKTPLLGSDVYVDGHWTMERFISVQTAIWEKQDAELAAFIAQLTNRSFTQQKFTQSIACSETNSKAECIIGDYALEYSAPQFGYSACSFWLTRFVTQAGTLKTKSSKKQSCDFVPVLNIKVVPPRWQVPVISTTVDFATPEEACASCYPPGYGVVWGSDGNCNGWCAIPTGGPGAVFVGKNTVCPPGYGGTPGASVGCVCSYAQHYDINNFFYCYNEMVYKDIGDGMPETAYCEISGYSYTKTDGTTATVSVGSSPKCSAPTLLGSGGNPSAGAGGNAVNGKGPAVPIDNGSGSICSIPFQPITIPGTPPTGVVWPDVTVPFPDSSFLLQKGSIGPIYPTFYGALVYDLQLKKWGKFKDQYLQLLDYQPLNDDAGGGIPYNRFGMLGGVLKRGGGIYLFDDVPNESRITYGKLGYYRQGFTEIHEVKANFRLPFTGQIRLNGSIDGQTVVPSLERVANFDSVVTANTSSQVAGTQARWHNISICGRFDLQYLEYRASRIGNR
jgi:hypothetical protein